MGGAGRSFQFSDLSVGTRRVIRVVTSLLFDKRSLMLIEQPEDSIHPGLLRKLIDMMRSYSDGSQIIFTTHSSEVLDILRPEEVLMTTARDGKTSVRPLSPDEVARARRFLSDEGSLSDFLEPFDEP
jgi:predicted ATPase